MTFIGAASANAQVNVTFDEGNGGLSSGEVSLATFDPGSTGGVTGGFHVLTGDVPGLGADPAVGGQGDPYLAVFGGETATFDFTSFAGGGLSQLGLDYGSADAFNIFTLFLTGGLVSSVTFNGDDIVALGSADGDQSSPRTNGRLTFFADAGTTITGLSLFSGGNSLETDNYGVTSAVPEAATWAMMLLGFGGIGFSMRRGRRSSRGGLLQAA
ncbi:PEPxxWA-CTERM sorting domain-containing protein [Sphingomonas piscis]|uniref:Npun_F0296 family exosortase-dependent surface protein n=1 Tax=Sphingomonas piscis TaxID=2714943 RepID=UPI001FE2BBCA|nr:PEPxxWA-CTERM sorting domain-containing protein [Sphingomonas piscis]